MSDKQKEVNGQDTIECACGHVFSADLGRYGCPNCEGHPPAKKKKPAAANTREINGSTTPITIKDCWQTPPQIITAWKNAGVNFTLDVAASKENAIAPKFYTEADNALKQPWRTRGAVWCNPPYSKIGPWVDKANEEAKAGAFIIMLVPNSTDTIWYKKALALADVIFVTAGRIPFINAATGKPVKGNTRGSMFLIWKGTASTPEPQYSSITLAELMLGGSHLIDQGAA